MIKTEIKKLIAQNKIEIAIQAMMNAPFIKNDDDNEQTVIMLSGQYVNIKRNDRLGLATSDETNRGLARITMALLNLIEDNISDYENGVNIVVKPKNNLKNNLISIIKKYKRIDKDVFQKATALLDIVNTYDQQKQVDDMYDPNKRGEKHIHNMFNTLLETIKLKEEDSLDDIFDEIKKCLTKDVPSYEDLQKAYDLANGRGFIDTWIEQQLSKKTPDFMIQIEIVERIEKFCKNNLI